ncbi:MAG: bifunctional oligoribonuclease/PAP phosphatase NrnA, partial [Candidatus Omnitrophica bacterium]|nr:bifunctional oligoribonuclease/PAP phosphatase NrnA [Candidatus Omnitrophota bacterium]
IGRLLQRIPMGICVDHHVSNQGFATLNWIDPEAAATGEMIYRLYRAFGVTPTREAALCLYAAIVTDTGSFRYRNTSPAVHEIAADLIGLGVSPLRVAQELYESRSANDLKLIGTVLVGMGVSSDGKVAWVEVPRALLKKFRASDEVTDELVNFPRSVRTAEVALCLREAPRPGEIRVSLRSKGRVNVDTIARKFGGGGHMAASGCTVKGTLLQARKKVLKVVLQAL